MHLSDIPIDLILLAVAGLGILIKSIGYVQEGEQGIRLRFGKAEKNKSGQVRIRDAGFVFLIPFVDTPKKHHVRQQTFILSDQKITLKGGFPFIASGAIIFRVRDVYKALFEIDDIHNCVCNQAMLILQNELEKRSLKDLEEKKKLSTDLLRQLKKKTKNWGIEVVDFGLVDCSPDTSVAGLVSMAAAIDLKTEALKTAAKVLGVDVIGLPSDLAAALIGMPVVTSIGSGGNKVNLEQIVKPVEEESSGGIDLPFGWKWRSLLGK